MIITLTASEIELAAMVAFKRQGMNFGNDVATKWDGGKFEMHVHGAFGECAVAKYLNLHWMGTVGEWRSCDVGGLVEVRTRSKDWHDLSIKSSDKDHTPIVLARTHNLPRVELVGWIKVRDCRCPEYRNTRPDLPGLEFLVPPSVPPLRPMVHLKAIVHAHLLKEAKEEAGPQIVASEASG